MSHRLWWLLAVFALAIGVAIEHEPSNGPDAAASAQPAQAAAQPAPLAVRKAQARGG